MSPKNPKPSKAPSYRHHKASGQAVVSLNGHDHYLGVYRSKASVDAYNRLVAEWQANGGHLAALEDQAPPLTVAMLINRYWGHPTRPLVHLAAAEASHRLAPLSDAKNW